MNIDVCKINKKTLTDIKECLINSDSDEIINIIDEIQNTIRESKLSRLKDIDNTLNKKNLTFLDLLKHLKNNDYDNIADFIEKYNINYDHFFEPQESLFRLFAILQLFDNINIDNKNLSIDFNISCGNYSSTKNIHSIIDNKVKFDNFLKSNLKDKGDISDLTFISNDNKIIIASSSKNFSKPHSKFDLDQINNIYEKNYKTYILKTIVVIPNKSSLEMMINRMKESSSTTRDFLKNSYKLDWDDLNEAYIKFKNLKNLHNNNFNIYPNIELPYLSLYMNQRFSIEKATRIMNNAKPQRILLGQKPRSGKTFIMAGIISRNLLLSNTTKNIYVIITPVPSETKQQYKEALNYKDFDSCQIFDMDLKEFSKFTLDSSKNIIILASKQYLGYKTEDKMDTKKIKFFKDLYEKHNYKLKIVFFDEVHHGGTTIDSKDIYSNYQFDKCHNIMVTATYDKPIQSYNLTIDNYILWDLDDEYMCKTLDFDTETKKLRLFEKHGQEFEQIFKEYTIEKIVEQYKNAPAIKLFMMDLVPELKNFVESNDQIIDNNNITAGFSMSALFKTKVNKTFEYPESVKKFVEMLFAKNNSLYKQIDDYCYNNESRQFTYTNPLTIMMFLPSDNVNDRSYPLKSIIEEVNNEFEIVIINNKNDKENKEEYITNNAKEIINKAIDTIKVNNSKNILHKKKGVIALLGMQASIGVTIKSCDIVILADAGTSNKDMTQQRMFRCGSDGVNKKYGFVIDTNYHRVFETFGKIANSSRISSLDETINDSVKYIIESNLLEFGNENWIETVFGKKEISDKELIDMIYGEYLKNQQIKSILQHININDENENMINLVQNIELQIKKEEIIKKMKESNNKGIKRLLKDLEQSKEIKNNKEIAKLENELTNIEKLQRLREIVDYILPLNILFYKGDQKINLSDMMNLLEKYNNKIYNDIINQIYRGWFIESKTEIEISDSEYNKKKKRIKTILNNYIKLIEDPDIGYGITDTIADLKSFFENKLEPLKLYDAINNYVSIIESNRSNLADISTPIELVNEMLDKLPKDVWSNPNLTWFDPAAGRGIFMIVIFYRLMKGLINIFPNESSRKEHILKNMLFMSEISPLNIELCKEIFKVNTFELNTYIKNKNKLKTTNNYMFNMEYNIDDTSIVKEFLNLKLTPNIEKKKKNGEVFTPEFLIEEMLDKLPKDVWSNPNLKWFDPAVGMGNFMIFVYYRLMNGLKNKIKDSLKRKQHIIKNMIYMSELDTENIKQCKRILNDCNIHEGDTLKMDTFKTFGIKHFDIIVGNPPFNNSQNAIGKRGGGDSLWDKFIKLSLNTWLNKNGYLVYVHPSGWRKPDSEKAKTHGLYKLMTKDNTMLYLEIHDSQDGLKTFQAGTRYDWYIIKNTKNENYKTIIKDQLGITSEINLNILDFLPNYDLELVLPLLAGSGDEKCPIIYSTSNYESRKGWVSSEKTSKFKYTLIHSTNKDKVDKKTDNIVSGIRYMYSSRNDKGHFGVKKVIFGDSGINDVIIDLEGKYGMTSHAMAIEISSEEEGIELKKYLLSSRFKKVLNACSWSNFQIDWKLFTYLKKDFYK
jgi:hypothetical protein|uniref:Helicase ATP-binding domain-containing protein n=1 Tax=viral metagenome TaxID=1070528 RepID=A0A6C0AN95_9ZZZZ